MKPAGVRTTVHPTTCTVFHGDLYPAYSCTHPSQNYAHFRTTRLKNERPFLSFGRKILAFHRNVRSFEFHWLKAIYACITLMIRRRVLIFIFLFSRRQPDNNFSRIPFIHLTFLMKIWWDSGNPRWTFGGYKSPWNTVVLRVLYPVSCGMYHTTVPWYSDQLWGTH